MATNLRILRVSLMTTALLASLAFAALPATAGSIGFSGNGASAGGGDCPQGTYPVEGNVYVPEWWGPNTVWGYVYVKTCCPNDWQADTCLGLAAGQYAGNTGPGVGVVIVSDDLDRGLGLVAETAYAATGQELFPLEVGFHL